MLGLHYSTLLLLSKSDQEGFDAAGLNPVGQHGWSRVSVLSHHVTSKLTDLYNVLTACC